MTICPIALAVGCEKCPAFKFCPLTTVLGDQEEKDEIDPSNKIWEENFPTADEHLDKMDDLEKNNKEEVILEKKKPLTKDERLALIKESAEKKSADDQEAISDVNYERAKKDKLERDLKAWKSLGTYYHRKKE